MRLRVTIWKAETARGRLGHWWDDAQLETRCGMPCAYHDGDERKLATGWIAAPLEAIIDCPECQPAGTYAR